MTFRARPFGAALLIFALTGMTSSLSAQALPAHSEPGISPDGGSIAFVSGGDIWTVASSGGAARLLVAHSAHESRPVYSPDGRWLAFNSNRNGGQDVFVMDLGSGDVRRLTHDSGSEQLNGFSRDGEWVYFTSNAQDISGMQDVYRVRVAGGTPMPVAADRYESEFFAAASPEDGVLAISTRGRMAQGQWWRNGHSHIDEAEIWTVALGDTPTYEAVSTGGKNLWPMYGSDPEQIYFMSDRSGAENLWVSDGDRDTQLTQFDEGRFLWPTMSIDGGTIAFERDFGIWTYDTATRAAAPLDIRLLGAVEGPTPETETVSSGFGSFAVSPDGKKFAFVIRGDVYASSMSGEVPATRVTRTPAQENSPTWSSDSNQLVYTSWRNGTEHLFAYDFVTDTERQLTNGAVRDQVGDFSPDGTMLSFARRVDEEVELRVMEWESGEHRRVAIDVTGGATWSPDSRWLAYGAETDEFSNVMVVPVDGGDPQQVSFLASSFFGSIDWSAEGDYLVYRTAQRTEPGQIVKIDLVPMNPTFDRDAFRELFNEPGDEDDPDTDPDDDESEGPGGEAAGAAEAPEQVDIDFEGIRRRGRLVPLDFSAGTIRLSPDGESAIVSGDGALHRVTFGPNGDIEVDRLSVSGNPIGFSGNGRELYVSRGGQLRVVSLPGGQERTIETSAEVVDDFERTKVAAFEQGWGEMRDGFYDADYHGADWPRVRDTFRPYIAGARTRAEFNRLMNMMLGELNASHLGHSGRTGPPQGGSGVQTGRLGLRFDRMAVEADGRFEVSEVVPLGPADISDRIEVGDELVSVGGVDLDAGTDLYALLGETPGEKVVVEVRSDGEVRDVELMPISGGAERQLVYRNWVESRRALVDELSGGRLGYVHIASMSSGALDQLIFDLDQQNHAKDGVVVDVRNNNGGFVNVYAIDILARRNYFTMQGRFSDVVAPARVRLGQRALLAPTVLVTNQHTLSDGEDFTEGYRSLELGSVVGEPTSGWIIFTGSRGLVDGTQVRMPGTFIRDLRGQNMELNPRPVDIEVERATGEWYQDRDSQLERAVEELLGRLGG